MTQPEPTAFPAEQFLFHNANIDWDADLCGKQQAKQALLECVVLPLRFPQLFQSGTEPVLITGCCGTGKTLVLHALAALVRSNTNNPTLLKVSAYELLSWRCNAELTLRNVFQYARENPPAVVVLDDLNDLVQPTKRSRDCTLPHSARSLMQLCVNRTLQLHSVAEISSMCIPEEVKERVMQKAQKRQKNSTEFRRRIKTEILCQLDGRDRSVSVVAASSFPWSLCPALRKRFPRRLVLPSVLDGEDRLTLVRQCIKSNSVEVDCTDEEFQEAVSRMGLLTCADVSTAIRDMAMQPVRRVYHSSHVRVDDQGYTVPCQADAEGAVKTTEFTDFQLAPCTLADLQRAVVSTPSISRTEMEHMDTWKAQFC